jgi:hypothetical protein
VISRRGLLLACVALATSKTVTAATGFHVTGKLESLPSEQLEGYAQIGNEFGLSAHPKSAVFKHLMDLVGHEVRVSVVPE